MTRGQFIARGIVPEKCGLIRGISGELLRSPEPVEAAGVSYCGTAPAVMLRPSIRFITRSPGDVSMTIGSAHIPAIIALIAGILILVGQ